jgi:hypothetical protein
LTARVLQGDALTAECHRFERCWAPGEQALRIRHNRTRTKFWWGTDCCPEHPQPDHNASISEDMKRLVWALNNWPEVWAAAQSLGLAQARPTEEAPMLTGSR